MEPLGASEAPLSTYYVPSTYCVPGTLSRANCPPRPGTHFTLSNMDAVA